MEGERFKVIELKMGCGICLIKAKNQGGLGLVDLVHQSEALLGKLLGKVCNLNQNCGRYCLSTYLIFVFLGMMVPCRQIYVGLSIQL